MYNNNTFYNKGFVNVGAKKLDVRFARNTSTNTVAIIIGSESDSYSYPKLTVTSFMQGHGGINENYADGWSISQITSLTGYDYSTTVPDITSTGVANLYSEVYDVSGSTANITSTAGSFSTTTNGTVQVPGSAVTITPGTWLIHASAEVYHSTYSDGVKIGLHNVTDNVWHAFSAPINTVFTPWHTMVQVTVTANKTYQIKIGRSITSGTSYARNVRLSAIKLGE